MAVVVRRWYASVLAGLVMGKAGAVVGLALGAYDDDDDVVLLGVLAALLAALLARLRGGDPLAKKTRLSSSSIFLRAELILIWLFCLLM